jgi:hypothetical protein
MKWNRRFIVCGSAVALLTFAGCKKIVRITVDQSLAPITATTSPGETLEWVADQPGESFDVSWQPGLCQNGTLNPIPASYGKPAMCTVAPQHFTEPDTMIPYTYVLSGNVKGRPFQSPKYKMAVGPGGCKSCKLGK